MFSLSFISDFKNVQAAEATDSNLEENDFGKYAIWFIANDIYTNNDSKWGEDTRISNIVSIKNPDNTIISYTFELKTKGIFKVERKILRFLEGIFFSLKNGSFLTN